MTFLKKIAFRFDIGDSTRQSILSRRFIVAICIVYCVLIIGTALAFHVSVRRADRALREAIESNDRETLLGKTALICDTKRRPAAASAKQALEDIERDTAARHELFAAIVLTRTEDENFFRVAASRLFHEGFPLPIREGDVVREMKAVNYVRSALISPVIDPERYAKGSFVWHNAYAPIELGRRKAALQFFFSAAGTHAILDEYRSRLRAPRLILTIVIFLTIAAVIAITAVFLDNYSYLIRNLSEYMQKAARGDFTVSLRPTDDRELNMLAESFNTLVDELKDRAGKAEQDAVDLSPVFAAGVSMLKEQRFESAVSLFRALTILKPESFGSYFNLGVAYAKMREYESALEMFEKAQRLNPEFETTARYIEKIRTIQSRDA